MKVAYVPSNPLPVSGISSPATAISSSAPAPVTVSTEIPTVDNIDAPETHVITESHHQHVERPSYGFYTLVKQYSYERQNYSGAISDNFERKLKLFNERCTQFSVADSEKSTAFSIMLSGVRLEYYFTHVKDIVADFDEMVTKIRTHFQMEERML